MYVQPFDVTPVTDISASNGSGTISTPFPINVGGSVSTWVIGATGEVAGNSQLRGQFARYRTTSASVVLLETAESSDYAGTWNQEESFTGPGGGPITVKRQRFLSAS